MSTSKDSTSGAALRYDYASLPELLLIEMPHLTQKLYESKSPEQSQQILAEEANMQAYFAAYGKIADRVNMKRDSNGCLNENQIMEIDELVREERRRLSDMDMEGMEECTEECQSTSTKESRAEESFKRPSNAQAKSVERRLKRKLNGQVPVEVENVTNSNGGMAMEISE